MTSHAIRSYSYLRQSRAIVLDGVRTVTPDQYTREFPIGCGSIARTLVHLVISEWYYIERMLEREVPDYATWPVRDDTALTFNQLEAMWAKQAEATQAAIDSIRDWDRRFDYRVKDDAGVLQIVTTSASDLFTQLCFHEVHHRAQVLNMLRQCTVTLGRDIDFNAMMFPRRPA